MVENELDAFYQDMYFEFDQLGDCIWKFNEQINELRKIELAKLDAYYPNDERRKALRWYNESHKLDYFFPVTLNYAFVMMVFVTIETHLMGICDLLYETRNLPVRAKDLAGSGFDRYMNFLSKLIGISRQRIILWPQISRLVIIRNCIVHTSGYIEYSSDEKAIRAMVQDKSYMSQELRQRRKQYEKETGEVSQPDIRIDQITGKERLIIGRAYAYDAYRYGRDFLSQICAEASLPATNKRQE